MRAAEQDRPEVAQKRRRWRAWRRFMDPARCVFLDETGTATNRARRYGRSPSGRLLSPPPGPHGHWRTTTFVAGLRQAGIVAPLVLDGPMTGTVCRVSVEQFLAPALEPDDVLVLDNLAATQGRRRPAGARCRRRLAPLPAAVFARPRPDRAALRQAQGAAAQGRGRSKDELWSTLGRLLAAVPPTECANYLDHCGYGST